MKKTAKIIAFILSFVMIISLCGCGNKEKSSGEKEFTYWQTMAPNSSKTLTTFEDMMMYKEMAKATGINIKFIHPAAGSVGTEAFQILLSSGDYPDMIEYDWANYAGGPDQAVNDGVIISLNDYLEKYAPNYFDYMEGKKGKEASYGYKSATVSNSGNYYGFKALNIGSFRGFEGLYVRKDMLDKWGIDIPETIDDWTLLFKTAKENGVKSPLTGPQQLFTVKYTNLFNTAWKVGKNFYVDNGKVKFGPFEKAYKDYVAKMAEWTKAGYVDIDYVTNDSTTIHANMTNGNSVAAFGYVGSNMGMLLPAMETRDPDYNLAACPYPVLKKGDTPWFQAIQARASDPTLAISVQCGKDDENRYIDAIKWCDYLYSDEGLVLKSFGIEGDTFTTEKGEDGEEHYIYTDKINKNYNDIGGQSITDALYHYMRPANAPGINQHPDYLNGMYAYEQQKEAIVLWNKYSDVAEKHVLPSLPYTGEEASRKAEIESAARDNLDAAISNIILGKASIDTLDAAVEKARKSGYGELLKIQQTAYDRYISLAK